jgi:hypothetical protein
MAELRHVNAQNLTYSQNKGKMIKPIMSLNIDVKYVCV